MRGHGATVVAVPDPNRGAFQLSHGIPASGSSCHTATVDGYVIEGHVPAEAVAKLLREHPDAVGLTNPGMPADAPGMGGTQQSWLSQPVFLIGKDGTFTPFSY